MEPTNQNQQQGGQGFQSDDSTKDDVLSVLKQASSSNTNSSSSDGSQSQGEGQQDTPIKLIPADDMEKTDTNKVPAIKLEEIKEEPLVLKDVDDVEEKNEKKEEDHTEHEKPHFLKVINERLGRKKVPIAVAVVVVTLIASFVFGGGEDSSLKSELKVHDEVNFDSDAEVGDPLDDLFDRNINVSLTDETDDSLENLVAGLDDSSEDVSDVTGGENFIPPEEDDNVVMNDEFAVDFTDVSVRETDLYSAAGEVIEEPEVVIDPDLKPAASVTDIQPEETAQSGPETMLILFLSTLLVSMIFLMRKKVSNN